MASSATQRVGLIIPSSNRMVESEMRAAFPDGVQVHVTRLRMTGAHRTALPELLPRIREAAGSLDDARCDVVIFHCTATSTEDGREGEAAIAATLREAVRGHSATTATAIEAALAALGARRIVLVTPYDAATNDRETAYLEQAGVHVVASVATDLGGSDAFCGAPASFWHDALRQARRDDADAYLLSCANIAGFGAVEPAERDLERPVVTSNQSVLWYALRALGRSDALPLGRLFRAPAPASASG